MQKLPRDWVPPDPLTGVASKLLPNIHRESVVTPVSKCIPQLGFSAENLLCFSIWHHLLGWFLISLLPRGKRSLRKEQHLYRRVQEWSFQRMKHVCWLVKRTLFISPRRMNNPCLPHNSYKFIKWACTCTHAHAHTQYLWGPCLRDPVLPSCCKNLRVWFVFQNTFDSLELSKLRMVIIWQLITISFINTEMAWYKQQWPIISLTWNLHILSLCL